jgi:hypothetical protein
MAEGDMTARGDQFIGFVLAAVGDMDVRSVHHSVASLNRAPSSNRRIGLRTSCRSPRRGRSG